MLIVKNLDPASAVDVDKLSELFPDATDIVVGSEPITGYTGKLKG